jgi:uncharacterized protein
VKSSAVFHFFNSLNDFLPHRQKNQPITYAFNNSPAIKDSIEAIGVPHTEVALIVANSLQVDFIYKLQNGDVVEVHPYSGNLAHTNSLPSPRFILDVHLGKLTKALRLLGFDCFYKNDYNDRTIVAKAISESRIVLTRDIGLLKHKELQWGYWLRSQHVEPQTKEVLKRFNLSTLIKPFTICLQCNSKIIAVDKYNIIDNLPPKTIEYFQEFYQCSHCNKVYWKGSHYTNMMKFVKQLSEPNKSA